MLSNFSMKIITKILVDHLVVIASKIISSNQFGFIKNRRILDCIIGTSEGVNLLNKIGFSGNMALKIDIRKAFDTID